MSILEQVGLSGQESRVFFALVRLGEAKTGAICKETKVASSHIYQILEKLITKGLVSYRVHNNTKIFMPSSIESLQRVFEIRQEELESERKELAKKKKVFSKLLQEIKPKKTDDLQRNYKYFDGINAIKSMWDEINNEMSDKVIVRSYVTPLESYNNFGGVFIKSQEIREKKKCPEKIILPLNAKCPVRKYREAIHLDQKNDAEWGVVGDLFYIQYVVSKKPHSFLIRDKIIAKTFEHVFDKIWKDNKK